VELNQNDELILSVVFKKLLSLLSSTDILFLSAYDKFYIDDDPLVSGGYWKLVPYFRLLQWCVLGMEEKKIFREENCADKLMDIFSKIDGNRTECDQNKLELLKFWDLITENFPELSKEFSLSGSLNAIFDFFISLRPRQTKFIEYNNDSLPYFYRIVYRICENNSTFLEKWMNHDNFLWAVRYLLVESQSYFKVNSILEYTLDLCYRYKPQYKRFFIDKLIEFGFPHLSDNFFTILGLTKKLLTEKEEKIHFCQVNGLTHLTTPFGFYRDWNPDMINLLLETVILAINWFKDEDNTTEILELKNNLIESLKGDIETRLDKLKQSTSMENILELLKTIEMYFNIGS